MYGGIYKRRTPEKRDIKAIVILLATQGMIDMGEIADPLHGRKPLNIEGARLIIKGIKENEDCLRVLCLFG